MLDMRDQALKPLGITRLADLTGLDQIGLPVWAAYRPNARSISVCQGKGLSDEQARLSAVMEAIETALAENVERLDTLVATADQMLAAGNRIVPLDQMAKCLDPRLVFDTELRWVRGLSLGTSEPVWAPYELIGLDWRVTAPWNRDLFKMSSVGLAAHFSRDNAILHGLLEAIEYDAVALVFAWPGILESLPRLNDALATSPNLISALERVRGAGFEPEFIDITTDVALPTILCILEPSSSAAFKRVAPFVGHACRLDREEAMLAALLEAVQTQATDISGARDDIQRADYAIDMSSERPADQRDQTCLGAIPDGCRSIRLQPIDRQIDFVRSRLAAIGIDDVFVFDLRGDEFDVACVSVVCPKLEVGSRDRGFRPGKRAKMRIIQHAMRRQ